MLSFRGNFSIINEGYKCVPKPADYLSGNKLNSLHWNNRLNYVIWDQYIKDTISLFI